MQAPHRPPMFDVRFLHRQPRDVNRFVPRHGAGGAIWLGAGRGWWSIVSSPGTEPGERCGSAPGVGSGQSFRPPAQGRGSDVARRRAWVVVMTSQRHLLTRRF